ncbi:MAG: hypothetical protein H7A40_05555 [Chlamydiales bacterium]|nr:hypothetical protein [Chlamydiales bacterium]
MTQIGLALYQRARDSFLYEGTNHIRVKSIYKYLSKATSNQYDNSRTILQTLTHSKEFYYVDRELVHSKKFDIAKVGIVLDHAKQSAENGKLFYWDKAFSPESMLVGRIFLREYSIATEIDNTENPPNFPIQDFNDVHKVALKTFQKLINSYNRDLRRGDAILSEFVYSPKFEKELAISAIKKIAVFIGIIVTAVFLVNMYTRKI